MPNPFRYFKTSPEIIRLTVMMYIRFPLSLRQEEFQAQSLRRPRRVASTCCLMPGVLRFSETQSF
jgi:hypothetical protein